MTTQPVEQPPEQSAGQPTDTAAPRLRALPPIVPATTIHLRVRHFLPEDDTHGPCIQTSFRLEAYATPADMWAEAAAVIAAWSNLARFGLAHQAPHALDVAVDLHDHPTWRRTLADDDTLLTFTGPAFHDRVYAAMYGHGPGEQSKRGASR